MSVKIKEIRVKLDEPELRALLRGGELALESKFNNIRVKMILSDIGFDRIQACLDDAVTGLDHYKSHTKDVDL